LDRLSGNIERDILGIDDADKKTHIIRQDVFASFLNKNFPGVQVDAGLCFPQSESLQGGFWDKQNRVELNRSV